MNSKVIYLDNFFENKIIINGLTKSTKRKLLINIIKKLEKNNKFKLCKYYEEMLKFI